MHHVFNCKRAAINRKRKRGSYSLNSAAPGANMLTIITCTSTVISITAFIYAEMKYTA